MSEELRQQMLELIYELLPSEEATALRERIDREPETARLFAEVQQASRLIAQAARLDVPQIPLSPVEVIMDHAPSPSSPEPPPMADSMRWLNVIVALAACLLLVFTIGSYQYQQSQLEEAASGQLRLVVSGPAKLQPGVENQYLVSSSTLTGTPLPCQVEYALYSPNNDTLFSGKQTTDNQGRLLVKLPSDQNFPFGSRLEVLASHDEQTQKVNTTLAVDEVKYATQLSLDKPLYQPGEIIYYRSLTLRRFGMKADREFMVRFSIQDPSGATVANSEMVGATEKGVGSNVFQIPEELAGGEYSLVVTSTDGMFPEEKRKFFIRRYRLPRLKKELEFNHDSYAPGDEVAADFSADRAEGGPATKASLTVQATVDGEVVHQQQTQASASGAFRVQFKLPTVIEKGDAQLSIIVDDGGTRETIAKTIPINLGKVEVKFYPEGGDLVAGVENRVYFVARDPLGEPVQVEGKIVDSTGKELVEVKSKHEGRGRFSFTPVKGESYSLKIAKPLPKVQTTPLPSPALPSVSAEQTVALNTGDGVFAAGKPLEVNVLTEKAQMPLVISAVCRGVQVGQQTLLTQAGSNRISLPLASHAGGVLRVTVFDYSQSPPKPVAERLVYREVEQQLRIRVADHSERYAPGDSVEFSLMVTDETGEPTPAVLGVSVVDDALLNLADDKSPRMTTHFLLTTEVEQPEDLEDANFFLSGKVKNDVSSAEALDLLLGVQGWRRFVTKSMQELKDEGKDAEELTRLVALGGEASPPAVFDNLPDSQAASLAQIKVVQAALPRQASVGILLSMVLLLGVGLLCSLRMIQGIRIWLPAVCASVLCLAMSSLAWNAQEPADTQAVAFQKYAEEPPPMLAMTELEEARELTESPAPDMLAFPMEGMHARGMPVRKFVVPPAAAMPAGNFQNEMKQRQGKGEGGGGGFGAIAGRPNADFAGGKARDLKDQQAGPEDGRFMRFRAANKKDAEFDRLERRLEEQLKENRLTVREYAHKHIPGEPGVRSDFTETLFWHPMLLADATGSVKVKFDLSDSVTTFQVQVDGHNMQGRIGSGTAEIISRIPFNMEPKLPLEVNAGDRIDLPLAVVNDSISNLPVVLNLTHSDLLQLDGPAIRNLQLASGQRLREYFSLNVTGEAGQADLEFRGLAGQLADGVKRSIRVVPPGFPKHESYAGQLNGEEELSILLPNDWVPGSLQVSLEAYPSTLADLQKGMDSILREPSGCFEQASTSNYPNVLAMQYMEEHNVADPEVTRRAKDLMKRGYQRLTGYECKELGYEWFGGTAPGHEALTAYGLMEFKDMAEVYDVDPQMVERTSQWLLKRRDGTGKFQRNARALDTFGRAPEHITNAYIVWALTEAGRAAELDLELKHVLKVAQGSEDPYLLALSAASVLNAGQEQAGRELLDKLTKAQAEDGHLQAKETSITRSGGQSLTIETTALAALAWLKSPAYQAQAKKAIDWIIQQRSGGGFGSTQSTILALKAMVAHSKASRKTVNGGALTLKRDNKVVGSQDFAAGEESTISVDGIAAKLEPGKNELKITLSGDNEMPYTLNISYRSRTPASHEACPLQLETKLAAAKVKAGETVALTAKLTNTKDEGLPMSMAIIGLPAGLQPRVDQLEELKKADKFDYFELNAREIICYWRDLPPKAQVDLKLDLVAEIPGQYVGPASRTYLYYTAEQKQWIEPLSIEITQE